MTREKAIKALGLMEHVESIVVTYVPGEQMEDTSVHEMKEACHMAVAALRAQPKKLDRSRWVGCELCNATWSKKDWCEGGAHDFRIDGNALLYYDEKFGWEGITIKFCPNCGRPLTEEAWAELERRMSGG